METLLTDWARVVRELKKIPTTSEYMKSGKYSQTPLLTRFGVWANVPEGMTVFAQQRGYVEEWKDVLEIIDTQRSRQDRRGLPAWPQQASTGLAWRPAQNAESLGQPHGPDDTPKYGDVSRQNKGREIFGKLMRPGPMICAPTNEQGVLFLFGAMAEELGFAVLRIRTEYPDCLAFRQVEGDRIELVRIEFEFESKNFLKHMHEASRCDAIVCWRHNWKECPVEVIELGNRCDRT
jgi:hypothetical protein